MSKPVQLARTAGAVYLLLAVLGAYAHLGVRAAVHVPGDATATARNLTADPTSFRLALVADIAMVVAFVGVGLLLFLLLRHVDRQVAGAMVVFVAVGAGMILTNLLLHEAALLVATDTSYDPLSDDQLVLYLVELHGRGYTLAGIFFGLWLLPLSHLAHRSKLFPRLLSILLAVSGVSWIVSTLAAFALPGLPALASDVLAAPTAAEFWLIAYLLVKGVRTPPIAPLATEPALPSLRRPS